MLSDGDEAPPSGGVSSCQAVDVVPVRRDRLGVSETGCFPLLESPISLSALPRLDSALEAWFRRF